MDPFTGNMGSLNFFHSLNLLELALRLCGLGVLGPKPVNKTHQPINLLLLIFIGGQPLRLVGFSLDKIPFIVTGVTGQSGILKFHNMPYQAI